MSHTKHGNEAPAAEREAAAAEREGLQMKAIEWLRGKLHIEPDDILILLEEDNGKFTGKKLTVQVYSTEREIEGLLEGYCVLMVENMGLAAWKVK